MPFSPRLALKQYAIPTAILVSGLILTFAAAGLATRVARTRNQEHFERLQVQAMRALDRSFDTYVAVLRGAGALAAADDGLNAEGFARYAAAAGVGSSYPGLGSLGLIAWTGPGSDPAQRVRAAAAARPGARFWPAPGGRESATLYIYPPAPDLPARIGNDLHAEPNRREAMDAARATGLPRLSGKVRSSRDPNKGATRLVLFLPVSRSGVLDGTAGAGQFLGWVSAVFPTAELFGATLSDMGVLHEIGMRIYDGAVDPAKALYVSPGAVRRDFSQTRGYDIGGRRWIIQFLPAATFEETPASETVVPIALAGLAITLSLTFASWLQANGLQRARVAEAEARTARDRSELLLKEVNHRVANSLQLVSTLVSMQADQLTDAVARSALSETRSRILAVARVHHSLYGSQDVTTVELKPYLSSLVHELAQTARSGLNLTVEAEDVVTTTDRAVSVGIVAAELVTNAVKYAYPKGPGEIRVRLSQDAGRVSLSVQDDGVGPGAVQSKPSGLGVKIVQAMAASLRGELTTAPGAPGHRATLSFPAQ